MNVEITSLDPFEVEFRLYNLLGEVDGHPKVRLDMATGDFTLVHDLTFGNLVSTEEHPRKGEPLALAEDSPMWPEVRRQVEERMRSTGFHDEWATKAFNRFFRGETKYPSYFFTMWNRGDGGEIESIRHIGATEYMALADWRKDAIPAD